VILAAAITKLGQPVTQGGAGITLAAVTLGSAVVNFNAENEISFGLSDAQGRSLMSGILHPCNAVSPNTPVARVDHNSRPLEQGVADTKSTKPFNGVRELEQ